MRKLLAILGALTLTATSASTIVSCSIGKVEQQYLPPLLQKASFEFINNIDTKGSIEPYFNDLGENGQKALYFDGIYNYIPDGNSLKHTFNAYGSENNFLNKINNIFNLGFEVYAKDKKENIDSFNDIKEENTISKQDIRNDIEYGIKNFDRLNDIEVTNISEKYYDYSTDVDVKLGTITKVLNKEFDQWKDGLFVKQIDLYDNQTKTSTKDKPLMIIINLKNTEVLKEWLNELNGEVTNKEKYKEAIKRLDLFDVTKQLNNPALVLDGNDVITAIKNKDSVIASEDKETEIINNSKAFLNYLETHDESELEKINGKSENVLDNSEQNLIYKVYEEVKKQNNEVKDIESLKKEIKNNYRKIDISKVDNEANKQIDIKKVDETKKTMISEILNQNSLSSLYEKRDEKVDSNNNSTYSIDFYLKKGIKPEWNDEVKDIDKIIDLIKGLANDFVAKEGKKDDLSNLIKNTVDQLNQAKNHKKILEIVDDFTKNLIEIPQVKPFVESENENNENNEIDKEKLEQKIKEAQNILENLNDENLKQVLNHFIDLAKDIDNASISQEEIDNAVNKLNEVIKYVKDNSKPTFTITYKIKNEND